MCGGPASPAISNFSQGKPVGTIGLLFQVPWVARPPGPYEPQEIDASSGAAGVYAGEEPPRRRVEIVRSPFHAEVAAARAGAAAVSAA